MEEEEMSPAQMQALNTFKALMKVKVEKEQQYCIWAYFLLDKPTDDGLYGKIIFLGAKAKKENALKKAEELMKLTGHNGIMVIPSGRWEDLSIIPKMDKTKWVAENHETMLRLQQEKVAKKEKKERERAERIKKEIEEEMRNEDNPTTLDHYTQNWFLAVKDKAAIDTYRQKLDEMEKAYQKRVDLIREQQQRQPEMESTWLPTLEAKMADRNESHIFSSISSSVKALKPNILPHLYNLDT